MKSERGKHLHCIAMFMTEGDLISGFLLGAHPWKAGIEFFSLGGRGV